MPLLILNQANEDNEPNRRDERSVELPRRRLLQTAAACGTILSARAFGQSGPDIACSASSIVTPGATEGPYYPVTKLPDNNADLTLVSGKATRALGQQVVVRGRVLRKDCTPVPGTAVELWQACASGRYMHPGDPNTDLVFDPNFQYFARVITDAQGRFVFRTVRPGKYPGRTNHLHFRIEPPGLPRLTTQLYFKDEPGNAFDGIYNGVPAAQRGNVTVDFKPDPSDTRLLLGTWLVFV